MDHSFLSAFILLLLVLDPLGSLPIFVSIMRDVPRPRRARVAVREVGIAFVRVPYDVEAEIAVATERGMPESIFYRLFGP